MRRSPFLDAVGGMAESANVDAVDSGDGVEDGVGQNATRVLDNHGARRRGRNPNPEILELQRRPRWRLRRRQSGSQDRVDLAGNAEVALNAPERREHGAHVGLRRLQRELFPSRSRGRTPASVNRTVRPTSSLRPNSDSTGICDGFWSDLQEHVAFRAAHLRPPAPGDIEAPSTDCSPWKIQNRSSTP